MLQAIGDVRAFRKENDEALKRYEEAQALFQQVGSRLGQANVLKAIGDVQAFRDDRDGALASYEGARALFVAVGDRLGQANTLAAMSRLALLKNEQIICDNLLEQAILLYQTIGSKYSIPAQIGNHGWELLRGGRSNEAKSYLLQAADLFEQIGIMDYAERHRQAANAIDQEENE